MSNSDLVIAIVGVIALLWLHHIEGKHKQETRVVEYHFCGNCGYITGFGLYDNSKHYNCSSCGFENIVLRTWPSEEELTNSDVYYKGFWKRIHESEAHEEEEEVFVAFLDLEEEEEIE